MKFKITTVFCFLLIANVSAFAQENSRNWNGKKCAVVLTYDDALNVHLDKVVPALDAHGLKGTFYVVASSPVVANRLVEWRKIAKNGHELGNHTFNHPCDGSLPGREWVNPETDLSRYTVERAVNEIKTTNTLLYAIDGKKERTFAYPCGDFTIGGKPYYDLVKNDFVGARGVASGYLPAKSVNLSDINAFGHDGSNAQQMIAQIEEAEKAGSFIVFLFHGVGGEHPMNVEESEHKKLLDYLKKREKDIWVATMVEVAQYIKKEQGK
ncbi:polysaccharide deacetylase family protein [Flavobacterium sp. PLA-1-15]|uniref:polysaccharide deacetylase family protein n=1 Tax=Flavobacterium sp. PLA-1-15 TaxID=3380533 RepID=UPI003B7C6A53